jgi:DUF1009 family protein
MLALIAGQGDLPATVAASQKAPPLICALDGFAPAGLSVDLTFRIETLGSFLADLKGRGVTQVCLCGSIARPPVDPSRIDAATLPLVPRMLAAIQSGDDAALRTVMDILEDHDFEVLGAHQIAPDIVIGEGVLSAASPDSRMQEDAARGAALLSALAPFDVGQACVCGAGRILAIEGAGGTDHMLASLPEVARTGAAILVKWAKDGQDLRADMPAIGPETITSIKAAGLAGLCVQAGRVILLHPEETVARANSAGLVLWSRPNP